MISQTTIDQVRDLSLVSVIGKHVNLKKKGANYEGLSPFTDEKTPSFIVSESKGIYKCFSSGKGGNNPIKFVQELTGRSFPEAVRDLANDHGIAIEEEDTQRAEAYAKKVENNQKLEDLNVWALDIWQQKAKEIKDPIFRCNKETMEVFGLGFAPAGNILKGAAVDAGKNTLKLKEVGLLKENEKGFVFDFFQQRIIFPIYNHRNQLVGFGGRDVSEKLPDTKHNPKFKPTKYLNSPQSALYNKKGELFGIHLAKDEIRKKNYAIITEGYYDVIAAHENGLTNTVAPCGTAFTDEQCELLARFCTRLVFVFDGDKAGKEALNKAIPIALKHNFQVDYIFLPDNMDLWDMSYQEPAGNEMHAEFQEAPYDFINQFAEDAVAQKINEYWGENVELLSIPERAQAREKTSELLSLLNDEKLRNTYIKEYAKLYNITVTDFKTDVIDIRKDRFEAEGPDKLVKLPDGVDRDEFQQFGFYGLVNGKKTGYYFYDGQKFTAKTNFTIRPLFHIYGSDNKRLIEITNGRNKGILEMPSKNFVSIQAFKETMYNEGNYITVNFTGLHLDKINSMLAERFPKCYELKNLGWQPEGFWAFADGVVEGENFVKTDEYGITQHQGQHYFLPAFSKVTEHMRDEDDSYKDQKQMKMKKSDISFKQWATLMAKVHEGENGKYGIMYLLAALFRDHIIGITKEFPTLFGIGPVETGKSYMGLSLHMLFYGQDVPVDLNNVSPVGLTRRLSQLRNGVLALEEYRNDLDHKIFQPLKGLYQGLGRDVGVKSNDNKTAKNPITVSPYISGQYLPTRDDNALFTRAIVLYFTRKVRELTQEQKQLGQQLMEYQNTGLSHILVEILKYRELVESTWYIKYNEVVLELKEALHKKKNNFSGRLMQIFAIPLSMLKLLEDKLPLGFTYNDIKADAINKIMEQSNHISGSDASAGFWKTVEYLYESNQLTSGHDFTIQSPVELKLRYPGNEVKTEAMGGRRVLLIRLSRIHPLYLEAHRKQQGETGVDSTTLKHYFKTSRAWIGSVRSYSFETGESSAYAFDYKILKEITEIDLERSIPSKSNYDSSKHTTPSNKTNEGQTSAFQNNGNNDNDDDDLPF